jgi:hypothetical protein
MNSDKSNWLKMEGLAAMKRIRGPVREFLVTKKQLALAQKIAAVPVEQFNDNVFKRLTKETGFNSKSFSRLKAKTKITELAEYIRNDTPFKIKSSDVNNPINKKQLWTANQEIFCQEIAADPFRNIRIAAERAGYPNPKYGYQLITYETVKTRIKQIQEERKIKYMPSINNILQGLFIEANSNMADYVKSFDGDDVTFRSSDDIPRDQMGCIKELKRTVKGTGKDIQTSMALKLKDSHKAKALLFKYFGLGVEGTNTDPKEFVQEVVAFSQKVNQIEAFPMSNVPGPITETEQNNQSEESKQEEFQGAIIQPEIPKMETKERASIEVIKDRVRVINEPKEANV